MTKEFLSLLSISALLFTSCKERSFNTSSTESVAVRSWTGTGPFLYTLEGETLIRNFCVARPLDKKNCSHARSTRPWPLVAKHLERLMKSPQDLTVFTDRTYTLSGMIKSVKASITKKEAELPGQTQAVRNHINAELKLMRTTLTHHYASLDAVNRTLRSLKEAKKNAPKFVEDFKHAIQEPNFVFDYTDAASITAGAYLVEEAFRDSAFDMPQLPDSFVLTKKYIPGTEDDEFSFSLLVQPKVEHFSTSNFFHNGTLKTSEEVKALPEGEVVVTDYIDLDPKLKYKCEVRIGDITCVSSGNSVAGTFEISRVEVFNGYKSHYEPKTLTLAEFKKAMGDTYATFEFYP